MASPLKVVVKVLEAALQGLRLVVVLQRPLLLRRMRQHMQSEPEDVVGVLRLRLRRHQPRVVVEVLVRVTQHHPSAPPRAAMRGAVRKTQRIHRRTGAVMTASSADASQ